MPSLLDSRIDFFQWRALHLRSDGAQAICAGRTIGRTKLRSRVALFGRIGTLGLNQLVEEFYGQPERAVPGLCIFMSILVGLFTGSAFWALCTLGSTIGAWNYWSARLVIDDLTLGPLQLSCPEYGQDGRPLAWLTFDDGPGPETLSIIRELNLHGISATFFFIGEQVEQYPHLSELREALERGGHSVANHSYTHPNFLRLSAQQTLHELKRTQDILEEQFSSLRVALFRPPYGYRTRTTLAQAEQLGLSVVGWNLNSLDFLNSPIPRTLNRVEKGLGPGSILLFHDGRAQRQKTVDVVKALLPRLKAQGFGAYTPR